MQASVDYDNQPLDRPPDCPEFALLYAPDTGFLLVSFIQRSSMCFKVSSIQGSVDDDDHLIDRPPDCPEYALLYEPDTGFLFGLLHLKVVFICKVLSMPGFHASFS